MSKPEEISEGHWETATAVFDDIARSYDGYEARSTIARAIQAAVAAEREKVRDMHRRAQKAEGAVQAAMYESSIWQAHGLKPPSLSNWLARKVLESIDKALARSNLRAQP